MKNLTKRLILSVSLVILITASLVAQNSKGDFFTEIQHGKNLLQGQQLIKLSKLEKNRSNKSISIVNVKKLIEHQKDGYLPFKLPGIQEVLVAKANSIEKKSEEDFSWSGVFEDRYGQVILISEKGGLYGHISIEDRSFELHHLGDNYHALVELDRTKFTEGECGTPDKSSDIDE